MRIWYNNILDNSRFMVDVSGSTVKIGRGPGNDIVLESPYVAQSAAVIYRKGVEWELVVLGGVNGLQIDGKNLYHGERHGVSSGQSINLFPFSITVDIPDVATESQNQRLRALDQEMSDLISKLHEQLLTRMDLSARSPVHEEADDFLLVLERHLEEVAREQGIFERRRRALVVHIAGHCVRTKLLDSLVEQSGQQQNIFLKAGGHWSRIVSAVPQREEELSKTMRVVHEQLQLEQVGELTDQLSRVDTGFWTSWDAVRTQTAAEAHDYAAMRYLKKEIKDIAFGYGPLEDLLRTPTISEIMVVDREHIYIEKGGVLENSGRRFISDEVTENIIARIVSRVGRRIDKSRPLVDARLTDGSRVNAVIPPLAVRGPCLTIRKFPHRKMSIGDLINKGSLTSTVAAFLRAAVITRKNIIVSGGTGTGKTTLLNCISDFIPDKERIITIEDVAELQIQKEHVVNMETKESNAEGAGAYTIRDLVRNALRMRPDRIVVGECRGPEALDMLQAMNTGHDGSLTTIHANSSADVILRLEVLVQMAAALPTESIHRQISSAINLVVQLARGHDGARRVVQITEIMPADHRTSEIRMKDIFKLVERDGRPILAPTGYLPSFMPDLLESGLIQFDNFYL